MSNSQFLRRIPKTIDEWIYSIAFFLGFVIIGFLIYEQKGTVKKYIEEAEKQEKMETTSQFANIIEHKASWLIPGVFYNLFFMLVIFIALIKNKDLRHNIENNVSNKIKNNIVLSVVAGVFGIYYIYVAISSLTKNLKTTMNKTLLKTPEFWLETFIFSFLFTLSQAFATLMGGGQITWYNILIGFLVLLSSNVFFELLGFYRWCYSINEFDKKCLQTTDNNQTVIVDLSKCKSYPNTYTSMTYQKNNQYHMLVFLSLVVFGVFMLPGLKYGLNIAKIDKTFSYLDTCNGFVVGISMAIALSIINLRRKGEFTHYDETFLIFAKFFLHHILWTSTDLTKLTLW